MKKQEPIIRVLSLDEWMVLMERGGGDWISFHIAVCDGDFIVVERDGKLLAYLQYQPHENQQGWHVLNRLETRPYYRRRGYACRLVRHVIDTYRPTQIIARGVQSSSAGFWQRIGFSPDGYGPDVEQGVLYSEGNFVWVRQRMLQTSSR